jgi:hypothetical protein
LFEVRSGQVRLLRQLDFERKSIFQRNSIFECESIFQRNTVFECNPTPRARVGAQSLAQLRHATGDSFGV